MIVATSSPRRPASDGRSPAPFRQRPHGFTLVELLVVITIIGILIALLLPAVQAAREAARQTECKNHLKQMALGCMNHERANGFLPTGGWRYKWCGDPDRGFDRRQPGGWIFNIMPYIEQESLYNMAAGISPTDPIKKDKLARMLEAPFAVVNCPTRRPNIAYPGIDPPFNAPSVGNTPHSDYAANGGYLDPYSAAGWWETGRTDPSGNADPTFVDKSTFDPSTWWPSAAMYKSATGVVCDAMVVKFAEITDGTSNTYLLGEKYINPDHYSNAGEPSDNNGIYLGFDWDYDRWTLWPPFQDTPGVMIQIGGGNCGFGSAHANGFQMAFCDGSVQMMSYTIDLAIHGLLGSRADGQPVDGKKW